jgi:hypothetical protein
MSAEPEPDPGTELERRGETLPDVSVAHRAGSIVSEFVSSIVDEAQDRGAAIMAEAGDEVRAQRVATGEGAARIQERVINLAPGLAELLDTLRREAAALSGEPAAEETMAEDTALPPRLTPPLEQEPATSGDEAMMEAVVVEDEEYGEEAAPGDETPGEITVAHQNGAVGEGDESEDVASRVSRLSDEDLARTYSNARKAAEQADVDDEYAMRLRDLVQAAVEEGLRRPAFIDPDPEPRSALRRRAGARKRRRRAVILGELREACRQAREQSFAGSPGR